MYKLGITGGIGSGKSTSANFFKLKGATIFDADEESKNLLISTLSLQNKIMQAFGSNHFINNQFDLNELSEIAFLNPINQKILNDIMWPEVFQLIKMTSNIAENNGDNLFIVDAALLFEAGNVDFFDSILLITAPKSIRIERVLNRKNIPKEQIEKRIALQMDESMKIKLASSIIENNGDLQKLHANLEIYFNNLQISQ